MKCGKFKAQHTNHRPHHLMRFWVSVVQILKGRILVCLLHRQGLEKKQGSSGITLHKRCSKGLSTNHSDQENEGTDHGADRQVHLDSHDANPVCVLQSNIHQRPVFSAVWLRYIQNHCVYKCTHTMYKDICEHHVGGY